MFVPLQFPLEGKMFVFMEFTLEGKNVCSLEFPAEGKMFVPLKFPLEVPRRMENVSSLGISTWGRQNFPFKREFQGN